MGWSMINVSVINLLIPNLYMVISNVLAIFIQKRKGAKMDLPPLELPSKHFAKELEKKSREFVYMYDFKL